MSCSEISAPVGLPGELMMMPRVRGVMAARNGSARTVKPSSACVCTITGVASASLICSTSVGQPGMCVMTSSPGAEQAHRGVVQRLLAAGRDDRLGRRVVDAVIGLVPRATARFRSSVPELVVYFVKFASIAACAAAPICASASESPAPLRRSRRRRRPAPSASRLRPPLSSSARRRFAWSVLRA